MDDERYAHKRSCAKRGYADEAQLQGWFTTRIAEHLAQSHRRVVAWDDVLESARAARRRADGVARRGTRRRGGRGGHDVVMVPQQWLYFDRPESDRPR